jgi:hypothetical protein
MGRAEIAKMIGRWITLFPAAASASLVAQFTFKLLNRLTLYSVGVDPDGLRGRGYVEAVAGLLMGAAFVYVGARVAPHSRGTVALIMAGIALLISGASLFASFLVADYWAVWQGVWIAVGAAATAGAVVREEISFEA